MKNIIIKNEKNYQIVSGNAISILNSLPASIYELCFNKDMGFSINEVDNHFNITEKLYGEIEDNTKRVLNTFEAIEKNLGVLFSGPKGLGKSLNLRKICVEAIKRGYPVILVKEQFDSISLFIETICQPVVIVFDEFEKLYLDRNKTEKDELQGQDSLLNLFDAALSGKKLFLLTCNDVRNISEFLLNRPGRLHYHFRMNRLSIDEITEYCKDNLKEENINLISEICSLGALISDFSYDMLRSIIFELNTYQCDLQEARKVLNIEARSKSPFNYTVYYTSGETETGFDYIDTASRLYRLDWFREKDGYRNDVRINMTKLQWTGNSDGSLLLDGKYICLLRGEDNSKIEKIIFVPANEGYLAACND